MAFFSVQACSKNNERKRSETTHCVTLRSCYEPIVQEPMLGAPQFLKVERYEQRLSHRVRMGDKGS